MYGEFYPCTGLAIGTQKANRGSQLGPYPRSYKFWFAIVVLITFHAASWIV